MIIKKFVPCIYLYHEHAVRNLTDTTIVDTDPVRLADYYCEHNADELIVFDMSEGDAEHDAALDIIKEICTRAEVDVIGAGNVKRMAVSYTHLQELFRCPGITGAEADPRALSQHSVKACRYV